MAVIHCDLVLIATRKFFSAKARKTDATHINFSHTNLDWKQTKWTKFLYTIQFLSSTTPTNQCSGRSWLQSWAILTVPSCFFLFRKTTCEIKQNNAEHSVKITMESVDV